MKKRIIVNGAQGKMGSLAVETLQKEPNFELVATLGRQDKLGETIAATKAEIVLDLTNAESVYQNSLTIIQHGAHPVIGSSGLQETQIQYLQDLCAKSSLGGIIVPNFSIGAVLMMQFAKIAAAWMSEVEIIEAHHQKKLDAPSGTALKTAELIVKARKSNKNILALKELIPGVRGGTFEDINMHSLRLPGILARQEVIFGAEGETLSIKHDSIDRNCFMPGVVVSCKAVSKLDGLYYGLEHILDLS